MWSTSTSTTRAGSDMVAGPPIVGLAVSPTNLDALLALVRRLPADAGFGYVVAQDHPDAWASALSRETRMPVLRASAGTAVRADCLHLLDASEDLIVTRGLVKRSRLPAFDRHPFHLHHFLRSLAGDPASPSVAVALPDAGEEVAAGLRAVRAAGGVTFVQDVEHAGPARNEPSGFDVDFRLGPQAIASELAVLGAHPYFRAGLGAEEASRSAALGRSRAFEGLVRSLGRHAGNDFSRHSRARILKRAGRRMALRGLLALADYVTLLQDDAEEARALAADVLTRDCGFFRDPAFYLALGHHILPEITRSKKDGEQLRIWVPGCSTGEEAYSIAIFVLEWLARHQRNLSLRLFATDLCARSVARARTGIYPEVDLEPVSSSRLRRFFEVDQGGHRVSDVVRDACVFAVHDIARDPPFFELDLVSCRNLLDDFTADVVRGVLATMHRCLRAGGLLVADQGKPLAAVSDLFAPHVDLPGVHVPIAPSSQAAGAEPARASREPVLSRDGDVARALRIAEEQLTARYAPPAVIVDQDLEVVATLGRTGELLTAPTGRPSANLLRLVPSELVPILRGALARAQKTARRVREPGQTLVVDGASLQVDIEVVPVSPVQTGSALQLVTFEVHHLAADHAAAGSSTAEDENAKLRRELEVTRDYLSSIVAEHARVEDDRATVTEQLQSINEELHATLDEVGNAKQELVSVNEEFRTLNDELQSRNAELDEVAADLLNFLENVEVPILMVDKELRIRKFTPMARLVAPLLRTDVGRRLDDLELAVAMHDLPARVRTCIETNVPYETEVHTRSGQWLRLRIRPYRRRDRQLEGAVLLFEDVDSLRCALDGAERARDYASGIVETVPSPLLVLDEKLHVLSANEAYYRTFGGGAAETEGRLFSEVSEGSLGGVVLDRVVRTSMASQQPFRDLELEVGSPGGPRAVSVSGLPISGSAGLAPRLLLSILDVTAQRALERERVQLLASEQQARLEAQRANHAKDLFLATLSHELRTPLNVIVMASEVLAQKAATGAPLEGTRTVDTITRAAHNLARLVDDLLDVSRIVSGKLLLDLQPVDLRTVARAASDAVVDDASNKGVTLEVVLDERPGLVIGDATRLQQVVANLLTNALKFTPKGGRVSLRVSVEAARARLVVSDTGVGIDPVVLPQMFERFVQAETSMRRSQGGLGLGLAIVRHLVAVHGGEVHAESEGLGHGSTFVVTLPLASTAATAAAPPSAPQVSSRSISGVSVLVIDDDDDTRAGASALLRSLGVVVEEASSASAGLEAVARSRPDVVLCDIAMPEQDGYAFARALRALPADQGGATPAAALTALATEVDRREALAAGFQMHVAKPVDASRLASVVAALANVVPESDPPSRPSS